MRSPFCASYLVRSLLLWCGLKLAAMILLSKAQVPDPLAFHVMPEVLSIVVAWMWLGSVMRRNGEDILLANLGFSVKLVFLQLVLLFTALSLLVSLLA